MQETPEPQAPHGQGPGPHAPGPVPYGQGPGPYGDGPVPYGQGRGPYGEGPVPYGRPYPPTGYQPPAPEPFLLPTQPGLRYDHLARNRATEWWRPLVGTLIVGAAFFVVGFVVLFAGMLAAPFLGIKVLTTIQLFSDPLYALVFLLLPIAAVLPVVYGTAALIQRRRPGTLSSVAGRLRWGWMAQCAGIAVVALLLGQIAMVSAFAATGEDLSGMFGWAGWATFLPALLVIVLLVPFQAATEEYIFRGWLVQAFGSYLRNPIYGILLGSLAFMSLHGYTGAGMIDVFSFGVVMGLLTVRTGGLEAAIAMHVINNVFAFGTSAASGELSDAMRQGAVPWQSLVGTVVQLGVFGVGVFVLAKKRAVPTISG
ncbi:type II CAAX prenyl endopeptidase Rce1 family protein [Nonomuraea sp. NPDC050328]|uniref:CPBP family intramembrane glutamic endopeptidase n=1 Tax=Nonomuraea sp. NPDC050328 TaxID=3364361 RepID=UPI0037A57427